MAKNNKIYLYDTLMREVTVHPLPKPRITHQPTSVNMLNPEVHLFDVGIGAEQQFVVGDPQDGVIDGWAIGGE